MLTDKELKEIQRKLLELEQEPPANGWKSINAEIHPPDKTWRPVWWFGALLLALLTGAGLYFIHDREADAAKQAGVPISSAGEVGNDTNNKRTWAGSEAAKYKSGPQAKALRQINEPESDRDGRERITEPKAPNRSEQPIAMAQPEVRDNVNEVVRADKPKAQGISIKLPITPVDSVVRNKPTAEIQENYTLIAAADSSKKRSEAAAAERIIHVASEVNDSINSKSTIAEMHLAAADSVVITVEPDSSSQEHKPAAKPKKERPVLSDPSGWAVGAYFAPRYAFRKFTPNAEDAVLITRLNTKSQLDPERMGYETGISISKAIKPILTLETGLSLVNLKENVDYTYTLGQVGGSVMRQTPDGQVIVEAIQVTEDRRLVSSYTYGGLKLGMNYYFLETLRSRLNVSFAGGMNLLLRGETKEYRNGEWTETVVFPDKNNILEQSNYNLLVGVGYNVALHPKYELTVMPALNYFLGSTFKEREPFGLRPYTLGVNLQVKRSLGW